MQRADIIIVKERLPDDIPLVFVVGVDGSTTGDRSFDTAVYFAAAHTKPVTIHVVHVYDGEIEVCGGICGVVAVADGRYCCWAW